MNIDVAQQVLFYATLALPVLAILLKPKLFPKLRTVWLFLICCVLVYAMSYARVQLLNAKFTAELAAFDLNGDGYFSGLELTPAQDAAMQAWANDTGRALAPITDLFLSPALVAIVFGIVTAMRRVLAFISRQYAGSA